MTVFRDLSQHLLDIAENGVKAGATQLHIDIEEDLRENRLSLTIQDNGCGMDAQALSHVTDPWFTTRTTRKVGLGIPFLKQTAEMCGGSFAIQSVVGKGTTTSATFQYNHIDRPPLGDIVGTLLCVIVGCQDVDVVYRHRVNDQEFSLDTREIREVLEDVTFSDPDVLAFLRGNLSEGVDALQGEYRISDF
ncbi:MAG: sensor histidine kinase [Anaerolineae bacterium]|nr:sensor histidine kinase [Anaerolineae bacterium]